MASICTINFTEKDVLIFFVGELLNKTESF